ncbi:synaptonemal complex protein 1-like [Prorops nasuta]|uniref:synaptonemal complex protein 1-like n=1 Tax=Prorops nasuta TaxID=863751 RepID=UPI0034D01D07
MRTHDSKIGATNKSHDRKRQRLTNRDNERRMNLPEAPLKKRSNWSRKIAAINDKQQCVERKPNITILRHESLKELKRSLQDIEKTQSKNDKVKRTVLNNYDDSKGNNVENKIKGIDERIRIMYNMRHKKVDKADKALKSRMKNKKKHLIKDKRKKINAVDYSNTDNDQVDVEEKLEDKDVDGTAYENLYDEINDESEDSNEDVKTDETLKSNWKRSENNEARIKDDDKTQESMKNPGQKQSAKDIEIMAEKILRFADEIAAEKEKLNAIRSDYSDTDFNGVVDKFGNNELGLLDEEDKRSLKALIKEIMNVQKNVNKTLNIIEGKLKKDEHSSSPTSQKHLDNSGNSKKNNMRLIKKNEEGSEAWVADQLKNILSKMINKPKNNVKNITVAKNEMKRALDLLVNIPDYASLVDNGLTKSKRNDKSKKVKDKIKERRTGESAVKKSAGKGSAQKNVNKASKKVAKKKKVVKPKKTPVAIDEKKVEKVEKDIKKILKEESSLVQSDRKKKSSDFIECIDDEDLNPSETKISESYEKLLKTGQYNSGRKLLEFSGEWENDDNSWIDENYPEDPIKLFYESSIDSTENYSFANIEANKTDDNILSNKHKAISHENSLNKISLGRRILSMKKSQKKNQQAKSTKKSKEVLGKGTTSSKDKNMKKRSKGKSREGKLRKLKDSQELEKKIRPTKLASESSSMEEGNEQQKEKGKCSSCICDIGAMLDNLKDLLGKMSDPVNDIGMFDCDTYEDIGSQIILSQSMMKDTDSQRPRNFEKPRDQKYVRPEKVESVLAQEIQSQNEFEIVSLPGYDINIPCSKDNADVAWMSSYNKPNYIWKRLDGSPLSGFVRKNGDLELYDVDAKDSGNYSCEISYIDRENEKPVENIYETSVQIVTLPIYTLRGGCRYRIQSCDDIDMEGLSIGFPQKLKGIICKKNICDTHVLPPYCYREQILINTLVFPSPINKLIPVGSIHCGLHCRKALQDKIALLLRQNLKDILGRPIIFRLPHREEKLVPSEDKSLKLRRKRGRIIEGSNNDKYSEVGLFLGCPAGYGLQSTHCVPCTSGSYSDDNASFCKSCPLGTYQPNRGAKACHACTNPFLKDCYNMLWNSSSMLLVIIGSLSAIISLISILIWLCCCGKKKRKFHESSIAPCKYEDEIEMQPFIKDVSDNDDEICEYDYKPKKKRKVKLKKKIGKDERKRTCETDVFKSKLRKQQSSKPEWKNYVHQSTLTGVDSYRSHKDYINSSPKRYYYRRPPLPSPDFDR